MTKLDIAVAALERIEDIATKGNAAFMSERARERILTITGEALAAIRAAPVETLADDAALVDHLTNLNLEALAVVDDSDRDPAPGMRTAVIKESRRAPSSRCSQDGENMSARIDVLESIGRATRILSGVKFASADDFNRAVDAVANEVAEAWARVDAARAEGKTEGDVAKEEAARFWRRVDENGPIYPMHGHCWIWCGSALKGYGRFDVKKETVLAHVYSWELTNGPRPDGLFILHRCDNPICVRPSHLFAGTQKDNVQDCIAKGRRGSTIGERNGGAKLKPDDVREIRRRHQPRKNTKLLASEYRVSVKTIRQIVRGDRWGHLVEDEALIAKAEK